MNRECVVSTALWLVMPPGLLFGFWISRVVSRWCSILSRWYFTFRSKGDIVKDIGIAVRVIQWKIMLKNYIEAVSIAWLLACAGACKLILVSAWLLSGWCLCFCSYVWLWLVVVSGAVVTDTAGRTRSGTRGWNSGSAIGSFQASMYDCWCMRWFVWVFDGRCCLG